MTSKISFSKAIIKEDIRKYWAIPVLGFVFYFITGIFFILKNYNELTSEGGSYSAHMLLNMFQGQYFPFIMLEVLLPMISAILIFRYMHDPGRVMSVHSQPFTRAQLLNSHALSCVIFTAVPLIITGIILLIIAKPAYVPYQYLESATDAAVNCFARSLILKWMAESFICSMFILAVTLFGGIVTGTSVHHTIAAAGFNLVLPGILIVIDEFCQLYLFGYQTSDFMINLTQATSPLIYVVSGGGMRLAAFVGYIAVTIAIYVLVHYLYSIRKLERATNGVVFKAVDIFITLVFGYFGMALLGFAAYFVFDSNPVIAAAGYVVGALLGMIIIRMITTKTMKVLNKESLKIMTGFIAVALVVFLIAGADVTGYENRIPASAGEASVNVTAAIYPGVDELNYSAINLTEAESLEAAKALHKLILDHKDICSEVNNSYSNDDNIYENYARVNLVYYKNAEGKDVGFRNDMILHRHYDVPVYLLLHSDEMQGILETKEFKTILNSVVPEISSIEMAELSSNGFSRKNNYDAGTFITDKEALAGLAQAVKSDVLSLDTETMKREYNAICYGSITFSYTLSQEEYNNRYGNQEQPIIRTATMEAAYEGLIDYVSEDVMSVGAGAAGKVKLTSSFYVTRSFKNTIKWLEENGYGDLVTYADDAWDYAVIYNVENGSVIDSDLYGSLNGTYREGEPESTETARVVRDPELLKELADITKSHVYYGALKDMSTEADNLYMISFYSIDENDMDGEDGVWVSNTFSGFADGASISALGA